LRDKKGRFTFGNARKDDQSINRKKTGDLYFDNNGSGQAKAIKIADFKNGTDVGSGDFLVVGSLICALGRSSLLRLPLRNLCRESFLFRPPAPFQLSSRHAEGEGSADENEGGGDDVGHDFGLLRFWRAHGSI
jgi:hypothetical protein